MTREWGPDAIAEILEELQDSGFEPPFYFAAVAANGAVMFASMTPNVDSGGFDAEFLAEHYPDGRDVGLKVPINIMVTDRRGSATLRRIL